MLLPTFIFILSTNLNVITQVGTALSQLEFPDHSQEICFRADAPFEDEVVCQLGQPGEYPPQKADYKWNGCCFSAKAGQGVLWALGSFLMSDVNNIVLGDPNDALNVIKTEPDTLKRGLKTLNARLYGGEQHVFKLKPAELVDLQLRDDVDDTPISGGRVSVSDESMHLVSYTRETDEDGYAVLPMIRGARYTATIRAAGFLQPAPLSITIAMDNTDDFPEQIVTLDRGVSVSGQVLDWHNKPLPNAQLVVQVFDAKDREIWNSSLDRPHAISKTVSLGGSGRWAPERPSVTADERGFYKVDQIPRGRIMLYAISDHSVPSKPVSLDSRELDTFTHIDIKTQEPQAIWLRIVNDNEATVPAVISIVDSQTGHQFDPIELEAKSASKLSGLPAEFWGTIVSDGCKPKRVHVIPNETDELTVVLDRTESSIYTGNVVDEYGKPVEGALVTCGSNAACQSKTDEKGAFMLEDCDSKNAQIHVELDDYAPATALLKSGANDPITLTRGVSLTLRSDTPIDASCELTAPADQGFPAFLARHALNSAFEHLARRNYTIRCSAPSKLDYQSTWYPADSEQTAYVESIAFDEAFTLSGNVLEKYSANAPYALIDLNGRTVTCDETGHFELQTERPTSLRIYARHWLYGEAVMDLSGDALDTPITVRLNDLPPSDCQSTLSDQGIQTVTDGASLLVDDISADSPWARRGIKRGDFVESCKRSLVLVRDEKRIVLNKN